MNYSLHDKKLVDTVVGFEYDSCCWIGRVVIERLQSSLTQANTRLLFQLEFVGFSRLSLGGQAPCPACKNMCPATKACAAKTRQHPAAFSNYELTPLCFYRFLPITMLCLKTLPHQIALGFACLTLACASAAARQKKQRKGPKLVPPPPTQLQQALQQSATPTPVAGPRTADFIVAVVNSEPITRNDVQTRTERVLRAMQAKACKHCPPPAAGPRSARAPWIVEKAQVQHALETGIQVDDLAVTQAVTNVAQQSGAHWRTCRPSCAAKASAKRAFAAKFATSC